jgi:hypothetical protein
MAREGVPLIVIQRQLGHSNLGITSVYLQGIDNAEIIDTVNARHAPMIPSAHHSDSEAQETAAHRAWQPSDRGWSNPHAASRSLSDVYAMLGRIVQERCTGLSSGCAVTVSHKCCVTCQ